MQWHISDGTVVTLGGEVDGASLFAQELREWLQNDPSAPCWPLPGPQPAWDPHDPALLDFAVRRELDTFNRLQKTRLTVRRPEGIPPVPPVPYEQAAPSSPASIIH